MRIMASCPISPRASSPTTAPSRSTTTRSAQCSTSFRRCEMKITATPPALSSAITFRRRAVSVAVRLEVGSSMMTMRASSDSALMISTSWRWASDRSATGCIGLEVARRAARSSGVTCRLERRPVDQLQRPAQDRFAPDHHVGRHVEIVEEIELLVHEGDARRHGAGDRERAMLGAVDADHPFARLDDAAQDLHQGRLAGAVLADQRQNLAALDTEADAIERLHAGVGLADRYEFEKRGSHEA